MTAEEIRKLRDTQMMPHRMDSLTGDELCAYFQAEIAAQLADLNAVVREPSRAITEEKLKKIEIIAMTTCNSETELAVTLERIRHLFYENK